jgi:hypothetical protein
MMMSASQEVRLWALPALELCPRLTCPDIHVELAMKAKVSAKEYQGGY